MDTKKECEPFYHDHHKSNKRIMCVKAHFTTSESLWLAGGACPEEHPRVNEGYNLFCTQCGAENGHEKNRPQDR